MDDAYAATASEFSHDALQSAETFSRWDTQQAGKDRRDRDGEEDNFLQQLEDVSSTFARETHYNMYEPFETCLKLQIRGLAKNEHIPVKVAMAESPTRTIPRTSPVVL